MALPGAYIPPSYIANGAGPYPITFKFLEVDHIKLLRDGEDYDAGFTVTGAGQDSGGELTLNAPLSDGSTLTIQRSVPYDQPTQFREGDALPAKTLEESIDRPVMQIQQLDERQGRSITFISGTGQVPNIPLTSNTTLVIDDKGKPAVKTASEMVAFIGVEASVAAAAASASLATTAATEADEDRQACATYAAQAAESQNLLQLRIGGYLELRN